MSFSQRTSFEKSSGKHVTNMPLRLSWISSPGRTTTSFFWQKISATKIFEQHLSLLNYNIQRWTTTLTNESVSTTILWTLKNSWSRKGYAYSLEVSKRARLAWKYLHRERQTPVCSAQHVFSLLFDSISPKLIADGQANELVALAFTMFYDPCLEGNSNWLRDGCHNYFKNKNVKGCSASQTGRQESKLDMSSQRYQAV